MRRMILGAGALQVGTTCLIAGSVAMLGGYAVSEAVVLGFIVALSSTGDFIRRNGLALSLLWRSLRSARWV